MAALDFVFASENNVTANNCIWKNMKNTYCSELNVRQHDAANTENTTKYRKAAVSTGTDDENCFKGTLKSDEHGWDSLLST